MMPLVIALVTCTTDAIHVTRNLTASMCSQHCQGQKLIRFSWGLATKADGTISWLLCYYMLHYARWCYCICRTNGTVLFYVELTEKYVPGACLGIQGYGCVNQHSYWIHARALCVWPRGLLDNHKKDQQNKECLAQLAHGKRKRSHCTLQLQLLKHDVWVLQPHSA